jgi:hypothetical protein
MRFMVISYLQGWFALLAVIMLIECPEVTSNRAALVGADLLISSRHLLRPPCPTANETPLLATPPTVTTTFPVVAPLGTTAWIEVELQPEMVVTAVLLNVTVLVSWLEPKFAPVMVTDVPTFPDVGDRPVMVGDAAHKIPVKPAATTSITSSCRINDLLVDMGSSYGNTR